MGPLFVRTSHVYAYLGYRLYGSYEAIARWLGLVKEILYKTKLPYQ